jgi:hypothetical protein
MYKRAEESFGLTRSGLRPVCAVSELGDRVLQALGQPCLRLGAPRG